MLNYDQAVYFLESILRMPPRWRDLLQNQPLEFLKLYMKRHAVRVPFQNMQMAAVDPSHRWFPSEGDVVHTGLNGKGGCCLHLNYFTKLVFQALGLESFVVRGDHYRAPTAGTHVLVMVKLYGPNEGLYLVEVGGAFPMLEPVPMDKHKLPYKTLQAGGFPYEFRELPRGWIGRFHIKGGLLGGEYKDKEETLRTYWDLKPRGFWEFDYGMWETFTNPEMSSLLKQPLMFRFFGSAEFRRLFPDLPENASYKDNKVLISKPMSKIGKVLAATGRPKPPVAKPKPEEKVSPCKIENGKSSVTNGNAQAAAGTPATPAIATNGSTKPSTLSKTSQNGKTETRQEMPKLIATKQASIPPTKTLIIPDDDESDEDEYEVVTEEEISEDDDDPEEDPKNFVFVWKQRIVIGDAKSRKIVKDYKSFEEMGEDLKKYFPKIPATAVDKAMEAFSEFEVRPSAYDNIL